MKLSKNGAKGGVRVKGKARLVLTAAVMVLVPLTALTQQSAPVSAPVPSAEQASAPPAAAESAPQQAAGIYRGAPQSFRILNRSSGRVEEVSARDFVRGAVAAEMPALYHPEALKAQAAAAYTYAVFQTLQQRQNPDPSLQGADFSADPSQLQVWMTREDALAFYGQSFDLCWGRVCAAADAAGGYLLLWQGRPIAAAYHAISAGATEDAAHIWEGEPLPCLRAVESEGDLLAAGYESSLSLTAAQLAEKLTAALPKLTLPQNREEWVVPLEHSPSGYVTRVQVGDQTLSGQQLRFLLGLRSSHFQVEEKDGVFTFRVQGYGHGAGLSQNGADYMARQGASFDEILLHYYPGATLALAAEE